VDITMTKKEASMGTGPFTSDRAALIDREAGVREEVGFIGSGPERIFSTLHAPIAQPTGAVLVCSSILAELLAGYQEEVWLCRRLAERGLAVRRFHYRGTGHSDGEAEDVTFERVREDALAAAEHLCEETGIANLAFVGTRVGALIAASLGSRFPGAPMAFIQPLLKGDALFKEIGRSRHIWLMREEGRDENEPLPEDMLTIMHREGWVDVLGYRLTETIHRSVSPRVLTDELGSNARPVQIVQVMKRKGILPEYKRFLDELDAKGFQTDSKLVNDEIAWWFHDTRRHLLPEIGDAIVPWIADLVTKEQAR
jgi:pimeloyl-ACP methyl ester carboxylesterase